MRIPVGFGLLFTLLAVLAGGLPQTSCSSSSGSADTATASDNTAQGEADQPGWPWGDVVADQGRIPLDQAGSDQTRPIPDQPTPPPTDTAGPRPELPTPLDVAPGSLAFGQPCVLDAECQSGLCWATSAASACTIACTNDTECAGYGLQCDWRAEGVRACEPPRMTGDPNCTQHSDCRYPYYCRPDQPWCDLPQCRFDEDCPAGPVGARHCNEVTRRCEDDVCQSIGQCTSPLDFCVNGHCGPAACTTRAQCAAGQVCDRTQGACRDADPCDLAEENPCGGFYNLMCVDGLCEVNPCGAYCPEDQPDCSPCADPSETCDPVTGDCRRPCTTAANCGTGEACDTDAGRCYQNRAPFAVALAMKGAQGQAVADVARGSTVQLDGRGSVDPDGSALTFSWRVNVVPPGALLTPDQPLPGGTVAQPRFLAAVSGTYAIELTVRDATGLSSIPAEVIVRVE